MSDKIGPQHRSRKAILYVRQSSAYQVQHNEESRRLQYAMESRLRELGWNDIEVIDDDLGRSAAGTTARAGFERMVAEVCLGHVGAVAAREVSRFARNSRDWQKLVEVCRVVDTVLIDQETVYDPRKSNDRLLLGLKGSLNEYELDLLRQRAWEARREKASRGELVAQVPVGFLKTPDQRIEKDPDRRVQDAIVLAFRKCMEFGSARQALVWMVEHGLRLPTRRFVAGAWETMWRRPDYRHLYRIVSHPVYAGAYVYGRTKRQIEYVDGEPRKTTRRKPRRDWSVLIQDHHEGYLSWEEFLRLQEMLAQNRQLIGAPGAPKPGAALLAGVLRCRYCGRKLNVTYTGREHNVPRYVCNRGYLDQGEAKCLNFGGARVNEAVSKEILRVVQPVAVEAALQAGREVSRRELDHVAAIQRDLEAARYEATRVERQFNAADPDNRLVTDELERRWNAALERVSELKQRLVQEQRSCEERKAPTAAELAGLAEDLQTVWGHASVDMRLKKRIIRTLIREIVVDIDRQAGQATLVIHWQGGVHTELRVPVQRRGSSRCHTPPEIVEAVRQLSLICADKMIAGYLNRNRLVTGFGNRWTQQRVTSLRGHHGIPCCTTERRLAEGWLTLTEAAKLIGTSAGTLRVAVERGEVKAIHPLPDGPWIFRRQDLDQPAVYRLVQRAHRRCGHPTKPSPEQQNLGFSST
jgi:DNA invertase Pin-like site-specific DNA recombinase